MKTKIGDQSPIAVFSTAQKGKPAHFKEGGGVVQESWRGTFDKSL